MANVRLMGKFYYSKKQRSYLDRNGRDRMFARLFDGSIVEYTQLIEFGTDEAPLSEDCEFLGEGAFDHFKPCQ